MATEKKVYKNPKPDQPLISTISTGCKTPILEVKFCNLVKPYYYANSPKIPRHSVTCLVDPNLHKEFLAGVQAIEKNEKVETIIKCAKEKKDDQYVNTGQLLIKFQTKDVIPVYLGSLSNPNAAPTPLELEDELAEGERIMVVYDILRYTKKNTITTEHGLSFKPSCIYYYPKEE
jgi:hypothetical protein